MGFTVAVDTTPLLGSHTGVGVFTDELLRALAALDEPPTLLPYVLSARARGLPPGTRRLGLPAVAAIAVWGRLDWPRERRRLAGADVVHGTNYVAPPTGLPTVLTVHDTSPFTGGETRSVAPAVRRLVARGAWVHAVSEFAAEQLRELLGTDRVRAVHHALPGSAPPTRHPARPARPYVVSVGTLGPRKNLPRLVAAYGAARHAVPDLALVLAGAPGAAVGEIDAAIAALAPGGLVVRTGTVSDAERADLLDHALVLAYPSLDEGFGLPLLEAMAAGIPVVASTVGAISEIAGGAALLVDPFDVDALAAALVRAASDGAARSELIRRGRTNVTRFSWAETANGLVALYRDAMAASPRLR